jgi:hypothetical protein
MKPPRAIAMVVGACGALIAFSRPCSAQMISLQDGPENHSPQNSQTGQAHPPLPALGVPGSVIIPLTTSGFKDIYMISGTERLSGIAGRKLPGMSEGLPLKAPMGAQDPSPSYMRPPVIGPLFCDPSINVTAKKFLNRTSD